MLIGQVSGLASAGSTVDKTFFYQIRLIHLFHSTGVLTYGGSYRTQSHRAALKLVDNGIEYLVVDRVKSALVDIQCVEGIGYSRWAVMPNLALSGEVIRPLRVVAPIRVK